MKFNKPTLITITAPTCSGKTFLIERLQSLGFNRIVGFTTRKQRASEVDGVDYYFITVEDAHRLDKEGKLAETASFRGNMYGVTHAEMAGKMDGEMAPVIILEPQGLKSYEKICVEQGWDIFKIYVTVPEATKLDRLNRRTAADLLDADNEDEILSIVKTHTSRVTSITGEERTWQTQNTWDAIIPGDDINKALSFIEQGIKCRNSPKGVLTT